MKKHRLTIVACLIVLVVMILAGMNQRQHLPTGEHQLDQIASAGRIRIGMSDAQVLRAWGRPDRINRDVNSSGTREQWVYERRGEHGVYLYLVDDVVTSFQD